MLDQRIRNTILTAKDMNAVISDWAAPAEAVGAVVGGAAGFIVAGVPMPFAGPVLGIAVGMGQKKMVHELSKKLYQFFPLYEETRTDHWRNLFVTVLTETFINYNVVFCNLLNRPTKGVELAVRKMAKDLVNRIFNYLETHESELNEVEFDASLMVKAILHGESEKNTMDMLPFNSDAGGTIKTERCDYRTSTLFENCDVVFFERKLVSTQTHTEGGEGSPDRYLYFLIE